MQRLRDLLIRWLAAGDRGATAVEYGLLVALIAGVIIGTVALIGPELLPGFQAVIDGM